MQLTLIRNATLRLTYHGRQLLIDPYLAEAGSLPSFTGRARNPLVPLPVTPQAIVTAVECVLVSHLHSDHFDAAARALLPKTIPLFCQPGDEDTLRAAGFTAVGPIDTSLTWNGIQIERVPGRHGTTAPILAQMGNVSGFVLRAPGEPTLYLAGDTVWYTAVQDTLARVQPDVVVTHSSGAVWGDDAELIVMDDRQTLATLTAVPDAVVVAVHLEALDHGTVTRAQLRDTAVAAGTPFHRLRIPADGETLVFHGQDSSTSYDK